MKVAKIGYSQPLRVLGAASGVRQLLELSAILADDEDILVVAIAPRVARPSKTILCCPKTKGAISHNPAIHQSAPRIGERQTICQASLSLPTDQAKLETLSRKKRESAKESCLGRSGIR